MKDKKALEETANLIKEKLIKEQENEDTETAHYNADNYLCELLIDLGFENVVEEYSKVDKWIS